MLNFIETKSRTSIFLKSQIPIFNLDLISSCASFLKSRTIIRTYTLTSCIIFDSIFYWDEGVPSTSLNCSSSLPARQFGVGHSKAACDVKVAVSGSKARRLPVSSEAQSLPAGHIPVLGSVPLLGVSSFRANHARYILI